jgi:hypothetical protein
MNMSDKDSALPSDDWEWEIMLMQKARKAITDKHDMANLPFEGVQAKMKCPICPTGELNYAISARNKHIHAKCFGGANNCVSWME